MKHSILFYLLLAAMTLTTADLSAQSFLKKLGDGIDKATQKIDKAIDDVDKALKPGDKNAEPENAQKKEAQPVIEETENARKKAADPVVEEKAEASENAQKRAVQPVTEETEKAQKKAAEPAVEEKANASGNAQKKAAQPAVDEKPIIVRYDNVISEETKGNVKEIVETNIWTGISTKNTYIINKNRQVESVIQTSFDGKKTKKLSFVYNADGTTAKKTLTQTEQGQSIGVAGEIPCSICSDSLSIELSFSPQLGENSEETTYFYQNGKRVKEVATSKGNQSTERLFDANERVYKVTSKYSDRADEVSEYKYNEKGQIIETLINGVELPPFEEYGDEDYDFTPVKTFDNKGRLISVEGDGMETKYTYNSNGSLASVKTSDRWWGEATTTYSSYEFDAQQNWTKLVVKKVGDYYGKTGMTVTTTRTISYH